MSAPGSRDGGLEGDIPAQGDLDRAVAKARAAFAWRAEVDSLSGEGVADGVRAEVTGSGGLRALTVPTAACREGGDAVARSIMAAVGEAQRDVSRQIRQSAAATFGEDSGEVTSISSSLATKFGFVE
ncbi:hypothetical protein N802_18105 [Knoellia sinensis KCTC 19936]|uniref:YbaB/EbfC DNA-binding family protein n=1 Tax=Knoellia sinensis KCTC 19936 TaxID=1385520 RepID=A0A0A0J893_9MICO|nr:hypothetical protein [Knoellia sinensis]KGN32277.1 hypothetical protein N802_18105 [Knoellia sinensis KCTC 19936]